jgi:hypothetical protein
MGDRKYLTAEEVAQRYRGAVSVRTFAELASDARWPGLRQNRESGSLSDR